MVAIYISGDQGLLAIIGLFGTSPMSCMLRQMYQIIAGHINPKREKKEVGYNSLNKQLVSIVGTSLVKN